jgi:L-ascorbate metabolism protein UlaG (beta-lactamase superfamily)
MRAVIELLYVGHATALLEFEGATVLTDPVLRPHVGPLRRHGPRPASASFHPDLVVISHQHRDHLDLPSLALLWPDTPVIAPRGAAALVRRVGLSRVLEMAPGDSIEVAGLTVTATEAVHDGHRNPWSAKTAPIGVLLEAPGARAYFPGDTDLFEGMAGLGPLDLALLPVWGWGPTLGAGHLDPAAAARALSLLRPRVAVPIHWGTLYPAGLKRLRPRPLSEPALLFARLASEQAPEVDVRVLAPGEWTSIRDDSPMTAWTASG